MFLPPFPEYYHQSSNSTEWEAGREAFWYCYQKHDSSSSDLGIIFQMQLEMKVLSSNFKVCSPWEEDMKVKLILTHRSRAHKAQNHGVTYWCVLKHKERLAASELVYFPLGTSRDLLRVCADGFKGTSFRPSMSKLSSPKISLPERMWGGVAVSCGVYIPISSFIITLLSILTSPISHPTAISLRITK